MSTYSKLKLPIMFLGPYHFELAPVELFFSFLKGQNLNKKRLNISGK